MDEILKVFAGAVLAFTFAILLKLAVEPVFALRQAIGKLVGAIYEHRGIYVISSNVFEKETRDRTWSEMRAAIGAVYGAVEAVSFYRLWVFLKVIPDTLRIQYALGTLTGLTNGNKDRLTEDDNEHLQTKFGFTAKTSHEAIGKLLNTRIPL